jgi:hypothetical protein
MATQNATGANVVPLLSGEADALRRATCHVLAEALRWSADQIAPTADEPDLAQCSITLGAVDRARALLDELTDHPDKVTAQPAYLRALVVQALSFHLEEQAFLCPPDVEALDAVEHRIMAGLPALSEAQAWSIVFAGEAS